jgi:purine-binding chemotaxis protein CheW
VCPTDADVADHKLLCFAVGGQTFGLPIEAVKETIEARPLTRLFLVPSFVAGLINLRGDVVAVLDLLALLNLPARPHRPPARNIVILRASLLPGANHGRDRAAGNRAAAGLLVDALDGVRDVRRADVKPLPPTVAAEAAAYLDGVVAFDAPPRPLIMIAPDRVIDCDRLRPFRRPQTREAR